MQVLVVHGSEALRARARRTLAREGARVATTADERAALAASRREPPDVVLVEARLTGLVGAIATDPDLLRTAIVVVAGAADLRAAAAAQRQGVYDVLPEPHAPAELLARVRAAARTAELRGQLLEREASLERLAYSDELTSLWNRRFMARRLWAQVRSAERHDRELSVALVDVDRFKDVNDRHGHAAGDEVLREIAARLCGAVRAEDIVGRWGGEEFLVLLPDTDTEGCRSAGEKLRAVAGAAPVDGIGVTVSVGCATRAVGEGPDELLRRADRALYAAKRAGRDAVHA